MNLQAIPARDLPLSAKASIFKNQISIALCFSASYPMPPKRQLTAKPASRQRHLAEETIYQFDPNAEPNSGDRQIGLGDAVTVEVLPQAASDRHRPKPPQEMSQWAKLTKEVLTPGYLQQLVVHLNYDSPLPALSHRAAFSTFT